MTVDALYGNAAPGGCEEKVMHLLHLPPNGVEGLRADHRVSQSVYSRGDELGSALEVIR